MISLILAGLAVSTTGPTCCVNADARIEAIVESAWAEAATQDPKLSKAEQKHMEELKNDVEIGKKAAERADKELKASTNQEMIDRVNRIGGELAQIARNNKVDVTWGDKRLNPYEYKFKVVESKEVNAFSLPGGFIYVYDGLLNFVESDDELAGVLAHEIAHASLRHLATLQREQSKLDVFTLPLILISILSGGEGGSGGVLLGTLTNQAMGSGWGQSAERAADFAGFQYIMKSTYNPVGMLTFMEKLAREQRTLEAIDWGIYRTHPPSRERATSIEKYIRDAKIPLRRSAVSASYRVQSKVDDSGNVKLTFNGRELFSFGGADAKSRADSLIPKLNEFFDEVPELYEVTIASPATILYRKRPLLSLTDADASLARLSIDELAVSAVRSIKRELYMLAFRVWDAR